jgi:hypothetical protein
MLPYTPRSYCCPTGPCGINFLFVKKTKKRKWVEDGSFETKSVENPLKQIFSLSLVGSISPENESTINLIYDKKKKKRDYANGSCNIQNDII